MESPSTRIQFTNWICIGVFILLGILNMIYIHVVPGLIYIGLAILYLPATNQFIKRRFGGSIPFSLKMIIFLLVIWATLGVGNLFELYESGQLF